MLTIEEKRISLIGNKTKRILETTSRQRESEERRLKDSKILIRKRIEKRKGIIVRY